MAAALAATAAIGMLVVPLTVAAADKPIVVVELFTSQGCNSCPPADELLGELIKRDDVLGFSFHVDYWDYIGWHDTFAMPESGLRQRSYVNRVGGRYVYTPQLVIGGKEQVVGHDRRAVDDAIKATAARPMVNVSARKGDAKGQWVVELDPANLSGPATVWLVTYDNRHDVDIQRGENQGKKLAYHNVVRQMDRIATWDGTSALSLPVDMAAVWADGRDGCAVIVQEAGFGPILGAVRVAGN
ncbi:MAG: DUF1223 domain-containing protein [Minwuia sp.]|nr:DUF1223 domain-containing protein [Minwuia sp.]